MSNKVVQVVGTGTIGEPLIGLLSDYKEPLGIDEVSHKNSESDGGGSPNARCPQ